MAEVALTNFCVLILIPSIFVFWCLPKLQEDVCCVLTGELKFSFDLNFFDSQFP